MKKFAKAALLSVIAMGTLALAIPSPDTNACVKCLLRPCPPCFRYNGGTCAKCPTCQPIVGCEQP